MMTLKLVDGEDRIRFYEAAWFTITDEDCCAPANVPPFSRKITAHDLAGGGDDDCWWVGRPGYSVDRANVFGRAYIMNSNGKTVEVLTAPPAPAEIVATPEVGMPRVAA